jgi:hypothetical protein
MNFIQHIQQIDRRIEERREEGFQKALFGIDEDLGADGALAMSTTVSSSWRISGGPSYRVTNGKITSTSMNVPGAGRVTTHYSDIARHQYGK